MKCWFVEAKNFHKPVRGQEIRGLCQVLVGWGWGMSSAEWTRTATVQAKDWCNQSRIALNEEEKSKTLVWQYEHISPVQNNQCGRTRAIRSWHVSNTTIANTGHIVFLHAKQFEEKYM